LQVLTEAERSVSIQLDLTIALLRANYGAPLAIMLQVVQALPKLQSQQTCRSKHDLYAQVSFVSTITIQRKHKPR
jgi:hypothetical protein